MKAKQDAIRKTKRQKSLSPLQVYFGYREEKNTSLLHLHFGTNASTVFWLRRNLICNYFIITHPEYNIIFPSRNDIGMLSGFLGNAKEAWKQMVEEEELPIILKPKEVMNKKLDNFLADYRTGKCDGFEEINLEEKESYIKIFDAFLMLQLLYERIFEDTDEKSDGWLNTTDWLLMDVMQKYFRLIGYWTKKMEGRAGRRNSGKGQKDAKQRRVQKVTESIIEKFVCDIEKEVLHIDKAVFHRMLCDTFIGAEEYPRHPQTIKTYKEAIEKKLGKKIKIVKKVPL